jgi:hypothetical protein
MCASAHDRFKALISTLTKPAAFSANSGAAQCAEATIFCTFTPFWASQPPSAGETEMTRAALLFA